MNQQPQPLATLAAKVLVKSGQYGPFELGWDNYFEIEFEQLCLNNKKNERCNVAVLMKRLDLLIRLVKTGHKWDHKTCMLATKNRDLNILKWLRDPDVHGIVCPWGWTYWTALSNGYDEIIEWLLDPNARSDGSICPMWLM